MAESRIVEEDGVEDGDMLSVEQEALLLRQCRLNKVELIERMLDSGKIKVNFFFSNGDNILIVASKCGFKKLVLAMMKRGANLDLKDRDGNTACHWAFAMGFNDLAEFMIAKGASDKLLNTQGYACRNWKRPEANASGTGSATKMSSSPHGAMQAGHRSNADKNSVNLPTLSPNRESVDPKSRTYKQDPRPVASRARKKGRTTGVEPTVYQRMYLALDEAQRSQSTPPSGHHVETESAQRPSSSCDNADTGSPRGGPSNDSPSSRPHGQFSIVQVGSDLKKKKEKTEQTLQNPQVPAKEEDDGAEGLTSIMKFVKHGGEINEPFSIEAMRKLGVVAEQIAPIDQAEIKKKIKDDRLVELRFKLLEERRQELLRQCLEERRRCKARSRDASLEELFIEYAGDMQLNIGEFMEMLGKLGLLSDGGDKPGKLGKTHAANIFRAFAIRIGPTYEITWEQFVRMEKQISADLGIKSIRCQEKTKQKPITTPGRGPDAVVDKHSVTTEDRIDQIRKKDEKNKELELRRIEKNFGRVLEVRAKMQAFKEQTRRLEAERLARLEAKSFEMSNTRIETEFEHVERLLKQEKEFNKRRQEEHERLERKQQEAAAALARKEAERRERNMMVSETLKVKQELRDAQRQQNERREEYSRKILREKIQRDQERLDAEKEQKEAMLRERRQLWAQKSMERVLFERAAVSFQKTGVLKKPQGIQTMGSFDELVEKKTVTDDIDKNTAATFLARDSTTRAAVEHGDYVYFKIKVDDASQILFSIKSFEGRAEMYLGNRDKPMPCKESHTWSKAGHDKITVFHLDRCFNLGYYYIGVYGQGQGRTVFTISASWSVTEEGREAGENERMEEAEVMQRVKERVGKVLASKLAGKDAAFVRKYEELFMEKQHSKE